jgi:hypothetical protein
MGRRLHAAGLVTLVEDERDLPAAIRAPSGARAAAATGQLAGAAALAADLGGFLGTFVRAAA